MAAKDLGTKHTCYKCSIKFYDLKKAAPICPKCGTDQRDTAAMRAAAAKASSRAAARAPKEADVPLPDEDEPADASDADSDDAEEEADEDA